MPTILNYSPGQTVFIVQEVVDGYGNRTDDGYIPAVDRIFSPPDLMQLPNYPQSMTRIDTGLYYYLFTLPTGAAAVGSYLIDIIYMNPDTGILNYSLYQIVVSAPNGLYGITPVGKWSS